MRHSLATVAAGPLAAMLMLATPAHADATRVAVFTTGNFDSGDYQQSVGVVLGHDVHLAPGLFAGPELSADKLLAGNTLTTVGVGGRFGADLGLAGKVYAVGGWASAPYHGGKGDWDVGAGYEHAIALGTFGTIEYRHYTASAAGLTPARDAIMLGFGLHF